VDLTGAQWPGFLFMGVSSIIGAFLILPLRETGQKRKKER